MQCMHYLLFLVAFLQDPLDELGYGIVLQPLDVDAGEVGRQGRRLVA